MVESQSKESARAKDEQQEKEMEMIQAEDLQEPLRVRFRPDDEVGKTAPQSLESGSMQFDLHSRTSPRPSARVIAAGPQKRITREEGEGKSAETVITSDGVEGMGEDTEGASEVPITEDGVREQLRDDSSGMASTNGTEMTASTELSPRSKAVQEEVRKNQAWGASQTPAIGMNHGLSDADASMEQGELKDMFDTLFTPEEMTEMLREFNWGVSSYPIECNFSEVQRDANQSGMQADMGDGLWDETGAPLLQVRPITRSIGRSAGGGSVSSDSNRKSPRSLSTPIATLLPPSTPSILSNAEKTVSVDEM
jgi:hypothetical protein